MSLLRRLIAPFVADEAARLMTTHKSGLDDAARILLANYGAGTRPSAPVADVDTVYVCVTAISQALASLDWGFYSGDDEVDGGPAEAFIEKPWEGATSTELFYRTTQHLEAYGNAFWRVLVADRGLRLDASTARIEMVAPWNIQPRYNGDVLIGWKHKADNLSLEQIIHFAYPNPYDAVLGLAPLTAARLAYEINWRGMKWQDTAFDNSGTPPFWIYTPPEPPLNQKQIEDLRGWFQREYTGIKNASKPPIMNRGLELRPIAMSQKDAEWVASQKLTREQVLAVFGVPPALAGVFEYASYANAESQIRMFWTGTIPPKTWVLRDGFNAQRWKLGFKDTGSEFRFDLVAKQREVLPDETRQNIATARALVEMGVPPSDAFGMLGIPLDTKGKPWLDVGWISGSLIPADLALNPPEPAPPPLPGDGPDPDSEDDSEDAPDEDASEPPAKSVRAAKSRSSRLALWRMHERELTKLERQALGAYNGFLDWVQGQMLDRLPKGSGPFVTRGVDDLIPSSQDMAEQLTSRMKPVIQKSIRVGHLTVQYELGQEIANSGTALQEAFVGQRTALLRGTAEQVRSQISNAVQEMLAGGADAPAAREAIKEVFSGLQFNATTISRTESTSAFNEGRFEAMSAAGVKKHEWLTAGDERVRESHAAQDGEAREFGDQFPNGLAFPQDPGGPPEETINCRCTTIPVAEDE